MGGRASGIRGCGTGSWAVSPIGHYDFHLELIDDTGAGWLIDTSFDVQ